MNTRSLIERRLEDRRRGHLLLLHKGQGDFGLHQIEINALEKQLHMRRLSLRDADGH